MGWGLHCNSTLADQYVYENPVSKGFTWHTLILLICLILLVISLLISLTLMSVHAFHYKKPCEQRYIIRILFVVPVYSTAATVGELFYRQVIYYEIAWNCYEAFVIASFFTLACNYVAPTLREQKGHFRDLKPKSWPWPLSWLRPCCGGEKGVFGPPKDGLVWINILWIGIFQYCLVKVVLSIVSIILQVFGVYCQGSDRPTFGHIWILVVEGLSVTVAKYCMLAYWKTMKSDLKREHKTAKLQLVCIMLVVYLTFWQDFVISILLSSYGPLRPSKAVAYPDLAIGLPALILNLEMAIYSIMHVFAYSWKPYRLSEQDVKSGQRYLGFWKAVCDAINPWDLIKAVGRGFRLMWAGHRSWSGQSQYKEIPLDAEIEMKEARTQVVGDDDTLSNTNDPGSIQGSVAR